MHRLQPLQSSPELVPMPRCHITAVAPRRGWVAARVLFAAALSALASASACGSDSEPAPAGVVLDAGPPCEAGTEGCTCIGGSGCRDGLLCIARRCLVTDTEEQPDPTSPRPPRPFPEAPQTPADPDAGGAPSDAGQTPAEPSPDASTTAPEDAGGEPLDAG